MIMSLTYQLKSDYCLWTMYIDASGFLNICETDIQNPCGLDKYWSIIFRLFVHEEIS